MLAKSDTSQEIDDSVQLGSSSEFDGLDAAKCPLPAKPPVAPSTVSPVVPVVSVVSQPDPAIKPKFKSVKHQLTRGMSAPTIRSLNPPAGLLVSIRKPAPLVVLEAAKEDIIQKVRSIVSDPKKHKELLKVLDQFELDDGNANSRIARERKIMSNPLDLEYSSSRRLPLIKQNDDDSSIVVPVLYKSHKHPLTTRKSTSNILSGLSSPQSTSPHSSPTLSPAPSPRDRGTPTPTSLDASDLRRDARPSANRRRSDQSISSPSNHTPRLGKNRQSLSPSFESVAEQISFQPIPVPIGVGLSGIDLFDSTGTYVTLKDVHSQIKAQPADINELSGYGNDPRTIDKIMDRCPQL
eukprot:gene7885-9256_t